MKKAVYYILLAVFIGVFLFAAYQDRKSTRLNSSHLE